MVRRTLRTAAAVAASALGVLAALALLPQIPRLVAAAPEESDRVLVVQANLQDSMRAADTADRTDLTNFVSRLLRSTPHAPDALLLTEILGPGARHVADELRAATGHEYRAVVAPGDEVFLPDGSVRQSAILVNTRRLHVTGEGGFVRVQNEDQAVQLVRPNGSSLRIPLVAGHVSGDPVAAVAALDAALDGLSEPDDDRMSSSPVVGVDFRYARCAAPSRIQAVDCAPQAFWTTLTTGLAFTDAGFETSTAGERRLTNYLFAGGRVHDGDVDVAYDSDLPDRAACKRAFDAGRPGSAPQPCRTTYYADEPFTWALVGPREPLQRSVVPERVVLGRCEMATRRGAVIARTVNNTDAQDSAAVTASAAAPVTVSPEAATLTVPPRTGGSVALRLSAPREATPGVYDVRVRVAETETTVRVEIPAGECVEPPAYASSFNPGYPPENAVDGDIDTFWHSEWSPPAPLPQSLTVNLGEVRQVSELRYQPRFDGNLNGTIANYVVYVSTDGTAFARVAGGTWPIDARAKTATFAPVAARYVRLEATSASGGSYASAAEVSVR